MLDVLVYAALGIGLDIFASLVSSVHTTRW
jgi:hypothetical protein